MTLSLNNSRINVFTVLSYGDDEGCRRRMTAVFIVSVLVHLAVLFILGHIKTTESPVLFSEFSVEPAEKPVVKPEVRPRIIPRRQIVTRHGGTVMKSPAKPALKMEAPPPPPFSTPHETAAADPEETGLVTSGEGSVNVPVVSSPLAENEVHHDAAAAVGYGDGSGKGFLSKKDYYNLIREKIETKKIYPERARQRMVEGRVTVQFVILTDGQVSSVAVVRHSGDHSIDKAAVRAVSDAGPFVQPPSYLFSGSIPVEITLVFELI